MKKIKLLLITILSTSTLLLANVPSWFKKLPESPKGIYLEVGCASTFNNFKLAREVAVYRAIKNLAKQIQIEIIFQMLMQSDGHYRLGLPDYEEIYEQEILFRVIDNVKVLDSLIINNKSYYLVQYPASAKSVKNYSKKVSWGKKPAWINNLPEDNKFIYGFGQTANYVNYIRAWQDTDSFSRFDLGRNICISVINMRDEKVTNKGSTLRTYSTQFYDIILYNNKVVERWYDKNQDIYYSLSRIPKNSYKINPKIY